MFVQPDQAYWNAAYAQRGFEFAGATDPLARWLLAHCPAGDGDCFEIGICPGRYSGVFAQLGYRINGIDRSDYLPTLGEELRRRGLKVGELLQEDFLSHRPLRQFDLVASLGFVEHFDCWRAVFARQMSMVRRGGLFVCEVPNFAGSLQAVLRQQFDAENLRRHNTDAMNLDAWRQLLEQADFDLLHCGPFGGFDFWVDSAPASADEAARQRQALAFASLLRQQVSASCVSYSPYLGVVARRR